MPPTGAKPLDCYLDMDDEGETIFIRALQVPPRNRNYQDLDIIYAFLRGLEALTCLRESSLRSLCTHVRYETHNANDILYCRGEIATCWYILLSGSVFIDGSMFLPRSSFGKRSQGGGRRPNECLILEPSGTIAIDYPHVELIRPGQRSSLNQRTYDKFLGLDPELQMKGGWSGSRKPVPPARNCMPSHSHAEAMPHYSHPNPHMNVHGEQCLPDLLRGGSVGSSIRDGSDTSSAYSGSDTMCQSLHSLDREEVDFSGLRESMVDSDEEDLAESIENLSVRDAVRECLEKDPSERNEDDIKVLLEFTERLSAFTNMTVSVRRAMCQSMVFAVVEEAGTVLMNDGEELDSWSVIINGHVEITYSDGTMQELHLGDSFGITPTTEKLYHRGVMRSKVEDCQFVCIRQSDYYRILHQGEENTQRHEEDGRLVLVTEQRLIEACHRKGNIVIKGTPERLMQQLVEVANELDPTYVEDFLLTHRTFIDTPLLVACKLLEWFEDPKHQDRVTRVVLRWVQSHFTDFEMDPQMMSFLEKFEEGLEKKKMSGQLLLLRVACVSKARNRLVTLTRPRRDDALQFTVQGRKDYGIFISNVEAGSKAEEGGLKRADQILEVNSQSFEHITKEKALKLLTASCHLAITVKSNLHAFNEMVQAPEDSQKPKTWINTNEWTPNALGTDFATSLNLNPNPTHTKKEEKSTSVSLKAHKLKEKILASLVPRPHHIERLPRSDESVSSHSSASGQLFRSRSNPDLSSNGFVEGKSEFPDHVLKVYRGTDQSTRFLPVNKETTAREVVMLSLPIFNVTDPSQEYALFEVSVTEQGVVRQKRLSDDLKNLAERIGLNSRYYIIKLTDSTKPQPSEVINDLVRESQVSILQISSVEVAIQLTLEDFTIFRQIELTEYIDNLFKLKSKYGTPALSKFEEISNKELYWVCTEICSEQNLVKRAKIIKQFIKIAKHCKDVKNFNSMFALLSGLGNGAVRRLRHTWARVSNRYRKIFNDLEAIMDPSRNMSKYRNLINCEASQPPMIPFFPIAKKDLTFHHDGNEDKVDGLINFEKLRMISRSIRELGQMCSTRYDPKKMLEQLGQPQNSALTAMNQGITGGQHHHITTVKRRKKSTTQPDKKKMFEEAQMVRRVKAYLNQLKIIRDEDELMKLSYECEPPSNVSSYNFSQPKTDTLKNQPQVPQRSNSPSPSTTSSASSTSEGKKTHLKTHTKFGAGSPTSERKMLALAENVKKPYHGVRPTNALNDSPNPSPGALRRAPLPSIVVPPSRNNHERSHSDTPVNSVDLSAESSSVTSLSSLTNLRKSRTTVSVSSNDCHPTLAETDSGISTQYDCHSSSSLEGGMGTYDLKYSSSPPNPHRRFSHQPEPNFRPISHGIAVLPPTVPDVCSNRVLRRGPSGGPPDYTSTQIRMQQLGRAVSHDGVQYYPHPRRDGLQ